MATCSLSIYQTILGKNVKEPNKHKETTWARLILTCTWATRIILFWRVLILWFFLFHWSIPYKNTSDYSLWFWVIKWHGYTRARHWWKNGFCLLYTPFCVYLVFERENSRMTFKNFARKINENPCRLFPFRVLAVWRSLRCERSQQEEQRYSTSQVYLYASFMPSLAWSFGLFSMRTPKLSAC